MELTILGSGTCVPTIERGPSGMILSVASHLLFWDGGGGSLRQMARLGIDFRQVDFICLSHFHPDHSSDLVPFLFATNYTTSLIRSQPLRIIGPTGLIDFYHQLKTIFGTWITPRTYPISFHEFADGHMNFPGFELRTLPMKHSAPSIGYRVSEGKKHIVYSGDTDYCHNIVTLGRQADLLILECSFPDDMKQEGHLTPRLAGRIAREAACKRLLLTHFYPVFEGYDIQKECQQEFSGEILLAFDGMKVII
jgi:ribonuclease BN (tRNA processing enzyme)